MIILLAIIVALLVTAGQAMYKQAVLQGHFRPALSYLLSHKFITFLLQPLFLGGVLFYVLSTVFTLIILQRYSLYSAQSTILSLSVIMAFVFSILIFHDQVSFRQFVGAAVLVAGIFLILK